MKPLAPNTLLQNRYLIVHLIGKGGMGEVYLAVDQRLGSAVALKRTLHGDDAQLGEAFEREARTLARLRHPALPKVSDHFIENGNQFLVMEHISGDDLSKRLTATQKPFPLSWALFWADQLLDALAYLHSHNPPIIHRDIKPQNLKLTDDNNIVLLDFGLSKNSTGMTNISGSGSTGSVVGYTPHYAPMEQIRGTGTNPRSDIYSLSATLYQLLTNVVPPDALSRADFLLSGKTDPIAPINEINHEIPKSISDVILKGMSISQDQRYPDAREMQRILRETYAQMQSATSDKTVAFSAQNEAQAKPAPPAASTFNDKTEQFSAPIYEAEIVSKEAMGAKTIPFGMMESAVVETPAAVAPTPVQTEQPQDFNATLVMDETPSAPQKAVPATKVYEVNDAAPKQSAVKTEVMGDFGAAEYLQNNQAAAPQNFAADDFSTKIDESFSAKPAQPNITGDKTVPLISFEDQGASAFVNKTPSSFDNAPADFDPAQTMPASAFNSQPQAENFATAPQSYQTTANESFAPASEPSTPQTTPNNDSKPRSAPPVRAVPEKKKSKAVLFGILGALFGLVILAAVGGGIAWYLMNQQGASNLNNTATPTPAVLDSPTPSPEPTIEQANTNTGETSNSQVVADTNTSVDSNVNTEPTPATDANRTTVATPTPAVRTTPTPRQTQITTNTPRPATPRPTAKPETKPTLRGTTIPQ